MNKYYIYFDGDLVGSFDEVSVIKLIKNKKVIPEMTIKDSEYSDAVKIDEHEKFKEFFDGPSSFDDHKLPSSNTDVGGLIIESFFTFLSNVPLLIFTIIAISGILILPTALFRDLPVYIAVGASFYMIFFITMIYIGISNSFIQEEVFSTSRFLDEIVTKLLPFLGASFILATISIVSFGLLIVPGVFVLSYLCFAPIIIEESHDPKPIKALYESYDLVNSKSKYAFSQLVTVNSLFALALVVYGTALVLKIQSALFFLSLMPLFIALPVMAISFSKIYKEVS